MYMENPADKHVIKMIEKLTREFDRIWTSQEDRESIINQVATLRASMNPIIKVSE